jgi:hypothetical protein
MRPSESSSSHAGRTSSPAEDAGRRPGHAPGAPAAAEPTSSSPISLATGGSHGGDADGPKLRWAKLGQAIMAFQKRHHSLHRQDRPPRIDVFSSSPASCAAPSSSSISSTKVFSASSSTPIAHRPSFAAVVRGPPCPQISLMAGVPPRPPPPSSVPAGAVAAAPRPVPTAAMQQRYAATSAASAPCGLVSVATTAAVVSPPTRLLRYGRSRPPWQLQGRHQPEGTSRARRTCRLCQLFRLQRWLRMPRPNGMSRQRF